MAAVVAADGLACCRRLSTAVDGPGPDDDGGGPLAGARCAVAQAARGAHRVGRGAFGAPHRPPMRAIHQCAAAGIAAAAAAVVACTPTLNWREVRPVGSGALALLPCRASSLTRSVPLAGQSVRYVLHACSAGGATWALAYADVDGPARVAPALDELQKAAAANLQASSAHQLPFTVPGATPNVSGARVQLTGKLPDGRAVHEEMAVFARATRVFQVSAIGEQLPADGLETFFGSIRLGP